MTTNSEKLEPDFLLHVLRNPYGQTKGLQRRARLQAANRIEELEQRLKAVKRMDYSYIKSVYLGYDDDGLPPKPGNGDDKK